MKNKPIAKAIFMFVLGATMGVLLSWVIFYPMFFPKEKVCKRVFSWKDIEHNNVKGYFFTSYKSSITGEYVSRNVNSVIDRKGKLNRAVWNREGIDFSEMDVDRLFYPEKYYDTSNVEIKQMIEDYGIEMEFCYHPLHGIVFWDKYDCYQGHINICYECGMFKCFPVTDFPGMSLNVSRLLFEEKGIDIVESYNDILAYSKKLSLDVDTTQIIFTENEVDVLPQFSSTEYMSLIDFLNSKNRNEPYVYPHTIRRPVVAELTIEPNGKVSHLDLGKYEYDTVLLWLWETTWQPATKNNQKVRCKIVQVFYL